MLITPSDSVLHDQGLLSVIFSYLSFPKQIQISCVGKDWQHASTNHKDFTFNCCDCSKNMLNGIKFAGNRFNNLEKITFKLSTYEKWLCDYNVHGQAFKQFFEKRAKGLRSVAIGASCGRLNVGYKSKYIFGEGFDSLCHLKHLTNFELSKFLVRNNQLQATFACFNQLISLKLDKIELTPYNDGWSCPSDSPLLLNVMKTIAKMIRL